MDRICLMTAQTPALADRFRAREIPLLTGTAARTCGAGRAGFRGIRTSSVVPVRKSRTAFNSEALISGSLVCMGSLSKGIAGDEVAPGHHVSGEARSIWGGDIDVREDSQMSDQNRVVSSALATQAGLNFQEVA